MQTVEQLHTRVFESSQRDSRNGARVVRLQLHHGATTSAEWMRDVMIYGSKQVSANTICTNKGELWSIVPGQYRAWTSGDAQYDRESWTVETANLSSNGWTISDASHEALAKLAAALSVQYGWGALNRSGPFNTWNVVGHREIYQKLGRSYPTACPGAMDLDRIVRRANEILREASAATPEGEDDMPSEEWLEKKFQEVRERVEQTRAIAEDARARAENIENKVDLGLRESGIKDEQFPKPAVPRVF